MSNPLLDQGGNKSGRRSARAGWQQILEIGQRLVALCFLAELEEEQSQQDYAAYPDRGVILAQRELIIQAAAALGAGEATLWLPRWLGVEVGYLQSRFTATTTRPDLDPDVFTGAPEPILAARALETRRLCAVGPSKQARALAIPLLEPGQDSASAAVLGVLTIERPGFPGFSQSERVLLAGLGGQAAVALQVSRRLALERWRMLQLAAVSEVEKAITSILDEETLLQQAADLVSERFGYPFVHLYSVHPGRRKVFYEAGSGQRSQTLADESFAIDLDDEDGIIPWVARNGGTLLANDVSQEARYRPTAILPYATCAELAIPLKFGGKVLGVLDIQSDQVDAFGRQEIILLEALADDIAIAMRNASLYRSERWRRQVADSLREVAGLISAEAGLDQVLEAILAELARNLPCDLAAIWFSEEEASEESALPVLRLAAVHGAQAAWLQPQIGLDLDDILEFDAETRRTPDSDQLPGWLFAALQASEPVTRPAGAAQDLLGSTLEAPPDYSAVAAALRISDKRLGLLTLFHYSPGRYGGEARAMVAAFASYAAVAIQNTRLYEAAHEQVWVSTVLLQVAEATQSVADLNELLATVVHITPMLVGVKACAVYLSNLDGAFFPAGASGLAPEALDEFARQRFAPGGLPALERLWQEKQPVIFQRQGEDLRLAGLFSPPAARSEAVELLVAVPIQAHSEVLGAMVVQYASDPLKNALQALESFFDERLAILQGIAHQTATAVDNIRLSKSQKEEAYVSVALLQVAQAVVSSTDLAETLGAIVRITPILTGVKRAVIYLHDRKTGQIRLSQAYGLPRDADTYPLGLDEFPLLAAALVHNQVAAYPLDPAPEDEWEDVPEIWTCLPAPEPQETAAYLADEPRLIIAFPLAVQDEILGVLLVEEPPIGRAEELPDSAANLRLRAKRLEITTGISQQAALTIQNDQFKRQMVAQERLEREMQLAREIQRTFLPEQLPALPGWELNRWWRTAREMGGDFYDIIDLPGGKLGLVIADVADKGMPAAMFMILIRALLRASVKDSLSPAEVLRRVNHLLFPDTHGGTFVTILYAVCDPATGELTYANAGHNPPLWVRRDAADIELLTKSGMALGVLEDTPMTERSILLAPGDFLVLYTDGVTDVFSPDGQIFGGERLYQNVWEAAFDNAGRPASAQAMLQALDSAVESFAQGLAPVDDSTMLILYRSE